MSLRLTSALAVPAIAMLLFAGCTGTTAPDSSDSTETSPSADSGPQSLDEACTELRAGLQELESVDATALQDDLVNDPEAAVATIDEVEAAIVEATSSIRNEDLRPLAEDAEQATNTYFDEIRAAAEDPQSADAAMLQSGLEEFAASVGELQTACNEG
ncbi:hypothetical protein GCM10009819_23680 [Agromyces tropicus]|uniref:Secreted protein n=1 Tax=Agromyces tropicus TaxID=555371 RepID=A0ABP5G0Y1_9MICO